METIKKLKPGQLCTISGIKYRCTKACDENLDIDGQSSISCAECKKTNGSNTCKDMPDVFFCALQFGYNCYPKKLKNQ